MPPKVPVPEGQAQEHAVFQGFVTVSDVHLVSDPETARSRGFAFVEMGSPEEAAKAIEAIGGPSSIEGSLARWSGRFLNVGAGDDEGADARKDEIEEESKEDVDAVWLVVADAWSYGLAELEALKSELQSLRLRLDCEVGE